MAPGCGQNVCSATCLSSARVLSSIREFFYSAPARINHGGGCASTPGENLCLGISLLLATS